MSSSLIYCVYLTIYRGNKLPPFYIGSSTVEKVQKGYHGSVGSKKWKEIYQSELKQNNHLFETNIIEKFETRREATACELEIQIENNVVRSDMFFNESYAKVNGFHGTSTKGIPKSDKMKSKLVANKNARGLRGYKQSKEHKELRSSIRKQRGMPENHGETIRTGKLSKQATWMNNGMKNACIPLSFINEAYAQGWTKGRIGRCR
jgi:hypothetical protein